MSDHVVVEADGGSRGNPGPAGYGAVVLDPATGEVLAERGEGIGEATNNVAEYSGLIAGLTAAAELGARRVHVRMDSKLVVEQMNGRWQVKNEGLRPLARAAAALRQKFDEVSFEWIPREQNRHADRLANEAMDRAAGKPPRSTRGAATPSTGDRPARGSWAPPTHSHTRLVLVRHGTTEHSASGRFSGRNELPLDDGGRHQAARLAARDFGTVAAVVSSPLRRAVETAQPIATRLGAPVETVDDFIETDFGDWEGRTFAEAAAADPALMRRWRDTPGTAPPGGESFAEVGQRVERAQAALAAKYPDATVVVVTHVTPIKVLVCAALEAPPIALFRLHIDTASVSVVDYFVDGNMSVKLVNDTSHLR
ncbi:MAG: ribonuclease / adenosylcobalamin/alpha-ribazole phosphatase [Pseudonocardiales bacterium]|nr:ribonuclease / adenosylcobalamin/alpha-ribazole phosphatase [Pseudonocardiales bacterium]